MLGNKIDAHNFLSPTKSPVYNCGLASRNHGKITTGYWQISLLGLVAFLSSCVMTKADGQVISQQIREINGEVAKMQRARHDMEVLLRQVHELIDRLAKQEHQLANLRETCTEESTKSSELAAEIQSLRGQLEEAQFKYRNLESDQKSLAENQIALSENQKKILIPPLKEEHFNLAKKLFNSEKYADSIYLLEELIKTYSSDKELSGQAYYLIGENHRKLAEQNNNQEESANFYKKSVINYQKIVENYPKSTLREEALFRMGSVLKTIGNNKAAISALKELLNQNKKSTRAEAAKKILASLQDE